MQIVRLALFRISRYIRVFFNQIRNTEYVIFSEVWVIYFKCQRYRDALG
jgi:hypothetical protein